MKFKFLNSEYRKAKREIKRFTRNGNISSVIEYNPNFDYVYKWLEDEGYYIQYINDTIVYISCENASKGEALKNKQRLMKKQYVQLVQLIEYKQSKGEKSLRIYSKEKCVLQDVSNLLATIGYKSTQNIIIVNNEQWIEFVIMWDRQN